MIKQETINEIINACRIEEVVGDLLAVQTTKNTFVYGKSY